MSEVTDALDFVNEVNNKKLSGRRKLLAKAGLFGAAAVGASLMGSRKSRVADAAEAALFKPTGGKGFRVNDYDILNFALNLEYLEAAYFSMAALGTRISDGGSFTGVGTQGTVSGGSKIAFEDPVINRFADELAETEMDHVTLLRSVLGARAAAIPNINLDAFTAAASAAGVAGTFDAFGGDAQFLVGVFTFEDVGVTAYNGAAPFISNSKYLAAAASILAVEAMHVGSVRLKLYNYAYIYDTGLITACNQISNLRQTVSAIADPTIPDTESPLTDTTGVPFFSPTNADSIAFARSFPQVLNIVYLNSTASPQPGGFFPSGLNGRIY
jgi:hypothetical protein